MEYFNDYITAYASQRGITVEEAEQHAIVKEVKQYYEEDHTETKKAGWSQEV